MNDSEQSGIVERVTNAEGHLERIEGNIESLQSQMRSQWYLIIALAIVSVILFSSHLMDGTITASRIDIVDKQGNVRGRLGVDNSGAFLVLSGTSSANTATFLISEDGNLIFRRDLGETISSGFILTDTAPFFVKEKGDSDLRYYSTVDHETQPGSHLD